MSDLTLDQAKANLNNARSALVAATTASAYSESDRSVQRANLDELRKTVGYWERLVEEMSAVQSGAESGSVIYPKWH